VDEDGATLGYGELDRRANRLAHHLISRGAGPGGRVAICIERSIAQIVAIHAVVKSGACYVPLDPELPDARISFILNDSGPAQALVDGACRSRIPEGPWQVFDVGADAEPWRCCPESTPPHRTGPKDLLHILYTSGTTGRPKGPPTPWTARWHTWSGCRAGFPHARGDTALACTAPVICVGSGRTASWNTSGGSTAS
jgi:non-ribosomal peptide synthetase component F